MIFVTVGNEKKSFSRLINAVSEFLASNDINAFMQTGYSADCVPSCPHTPFLSREEFFEYVSTSQLVITHAGAGTLLQLAKLRKRPLVVPRMKCFNEHLNDHQLDIAGEFERLELCRVVTDEKLLAKEISLMLARNEEIKFSSSRGDLLSSIKQDLEL